MTTRPLLIPLLGMIAGLSSAWHTSYFFPHSTVPLLLAVLLATMFLKWRWPFPAALLLFFIVWGNVSLGTYLNPPLRRDDISTLLPLRGLIVEGVIESRPEATELGSRFYLRAEKVFRGKEWASVTGNLLISVGSGKIGEVTGDRVRFRCRLHRPNYFGTPGEFDYVRHLACRDVFVTGFVPTADGVILMRQGVASPLEGKIDRVAVAIGSFIDRAVGGSEAGILRALLIGDRGGVGKATEEAFARTGVNHILSISGFHIGIIASFLFALFFVVGRWSEFLALHFNLRRALLLVALPVIVLYLFISGAAPATVRSVIMIGVGIVALTLEREIDPLNTLVLAAFVILVVWPPALFDISFQLSFLAFWGMIVITPLLIPLFDKVSKRWLRWLGLSLAASVAAIIVTLVPVSYYFHRATVVGLIANLVVVPLMGYGAVVTGFLAFPLIYLWPQGAKLLLIVAAYLVKGSCASVNLLSSLPLLPFWNPGRLHLLIFYLSLLGFTLISGRRWRYLLVGVTAVLFIAISLSVRGGDGNLTATFLSVGQGETTLVSFPDGKNMLIDGGGSGRDGGMDPGERLVAPALWRLGISRVDCIVLTHSHPDHLQGLLYLARHFPVGEFWTTSRVPDSDLARELYSVLAANRVPIRILNAETPTFSWGGAIIEPLWPPQEQVVTDENDNSLVFRLRQREFSILFTGDIGESVEERLLVRSDRLRSTVLKVAHHGSRYSSSSAFLAAVSPQIAVISAGLENSLGLPASETVERIAAVKARLLRTDLDRSIRISASDSGYHAYTWSPAGYFVDMR